MQNALCFLKIYMSFILLVLLKNCHKEWVKKLPEVVLSLGVHHFFNFISVDISCRRLYIQQIDFIVYIELAMLKLHLHQFSWFKYDWISTKSHLSISRCVDHFYTLFDFFNFSQLFSLIGFCEWFGSWGNEWTWHNLTL